ncbi:DNA-3-methyladenine glycosylase I [Roseivirga pacifica]
MAITHGYCLAVYEGRLSDIHKHYHDNEYGFPAKDDNELFGRMLLEINQAGLSWDIVLKKRASIKAAYADFEIDKVAKFTEDDVTLLLQNPGIIRMRLKILAAIHNAKVIQNLQNSHGSYANWLAEKQGLSIEEWIKLFKKTFKFMGKETTKEFLMSTAYIAGAHDPECPIFNKAKISQ